VITPVLPHTGALRVVCKLFPLFSTSKLLGPLQTSYCTGRDTLRLAFFYFLTTCTYVINFYTFVTLFGYFASHPFSWFFAPVLFPTILLPDRCRPIQHVCPLIPRYSSLLPARCIHLFFFYLHIIAAWRSVSQSYPITTQMHSVTPFPPSPTSIYCCSSFSICR